MSSSEQGQGDILLVDDEKEACDHLVRSLKRREAGFTFHQANTSEQALALALKTKPKVCVVDLSLDPAVGPESGLSLITKLLNQDSTTRVLVLTGNDSEEFGIKSLSSGAASFLRKPVNVDHLLPLLHDGATYCSLKRAYQKLSKTSDQYAKMIGISSNNKLMLESIEKAAYASTNKQAVLITGETGTGKGVFAQAIHNASERREKPFIRLQPHFGGQDLASSEIFGHEKGAFTGATEKRVGLIEEANGGTFFIDEVDELPLETQVLLLNVLQEKVFRRLGSNKPLKSNFRLIAATNQSPEVSIEKGKLRADFFHRISHLRIDLPSLKERKEDIAKLAKGFYLELTNSENLSVQGVSEAAIAKLSSYTWPGNVRELEAAVEGGVYMASFKNHRFVEPEDISIPGEKSTSAPGTSFREKVQAYEKKLIEDALAANDQNQSKAAQSLSLDRSTLRRILKKG